MGNCFGTVKKHAAARLTAVVKEVTGKTYRLRLAKETTTSQTAAPSVDPLKELAERARLAGVELIEQ